MTPSRRIGWLLCLSVSSALVACDGDNGNEIEDSGPKDSGTPTEDARASDAEVDSDGGAIDAGGTEDAGVDAGLGRDASPPADAGPGLVYDVMLTTGASVSPCGAAGPAATGMATVILGWSETWLTVNLTYQNLSSPVTMAHIHYGAADENGPVVLSLGTSLASPIALSLNASNYYAAPGAPVSFEAFIPELKAGKAYLNVHTQSCPDGEIRAQIQ